MKRRTTKSKNEEQSPTVAPVRPDEDLSYEEAVLYVLEECLLSADQVLGVPALIGPVGTFKTTLIERVVARRLAERLGRPVGVTVCIPALLFPHEIGVVVRRRDAEDRVIVTRPQPVLFPEPPPEEALHILVFDELDKADAENRHALLRVLNERMIQGYEYDPRVRFALAANEFAHPPEDALLNRVLWIPWPEPGNQRWWVKFCPDPEIFEEVVETPPAVLPPRYSTGRLFRALYGADFSRSDLEAAWRWERRTEGDYRGWFSRDRFWESPRVRKIVLEGLLPSEKAQRLFDKLAARIPHSAASLMHWAKTVPPQRLVVEFPLMWRRVFELSVALKDPRVEDDFLLALHDRAESDPTGEVAKALVIPDSAVRARWTGSLEDIQRAVEDARREYEARVGNGGEGRE